ncbi:hypothetical protein ASF65_04755 [Aureimonas sp. Leaf324]|nr:hypothetical protein ASF65_04755 [Aureimonas sp. Leaf324]
MIAIASQIQEMELASRLRETEVTRAVQRGTMRESVGEMHIARLRAGIATLRWLERNEAKIKARVAGATS